MPPVKRKPSDHWMTPTGTVNRSFSISAFTKLNSVFDFQVDAAADPSNHLCDVWFGPGSPVELFDSLKAEAEEWLEHGSRFFLNPPLSQPAGPLLRWMRKADDVAKAGPALVVAVVPATPSTVWFQERAVHGPRFFPRARIRFIPPTDLKTDNPGARHDSMVILFVGDLYRDGVWL